MPSSPLCHFFLYPDRNINLWGDSRSATMRSDKVTGVDTFKFTQNRPSLGLEFWFKWEFGSQSHKFILPAVLKNKKRESPKI